MEISGGILKNDDISAAAFQRFISQPASGRSSALPCLAAILVLSEIWRLLRLHGLFFGTETSLKTVLETYIREVTTLVHLTVNGEEIITTIDHPFYVNDRGFIKAGELIVGDELLNSNCNVLLIENHSVELTDEPTTVYNFQKVS
ncbi:MAG: polymorphic toxin-type HINT domain-containing protein [Ruminococcus bicirculans (ex Wegman et al. 2014)]|uniref:polymorphic toxin-type HINT domain-containing protein n=1 Tax=Ruminococcus bicirculans (ex Wegman et al. 2014) TaxID=1160721 RepID=UPI00399FD82B